MKSWAWRRSSRVAVAPLPSGNEQLIKYLARRAPQAGRPVRLVRPSGVLALDVRTPICDLTCEALGVDPVRRG